MYVSPLIGELIFAPDQVPGFFIGFVNPIQGYHSAPSELGPDRRSNAN